MRRIEYNQRDFKRNSRCWSGSKLVSGLREYPYINNGNTLWIRNCYSFHSGYYGSRSVLFRKVESKSFSKDNF